MNCQRFISRASSKIWIFQRNSRKKKYDFYNKAVTQPVPVWKNISWSFSLYLGWLSSESFERPTHISWNSQYVRVETRVHAHEGVDTRWQRRNPPKSRRGTYDSWGCLRAPWPKFIRLRNPLSQDDYSLSNQTRKRCLSSGRWNHRPRRRSPWETTYVKNESCVYAG